MEETGAGLNMPPQEIAARAFSFGCRVLRLCDRLLKRGGAIALVARQLAASGTSVGAHLEEAKGAQTRPDFVTKICGALKEARESLYWLRLTEATLAEKPVELQPLLKEADELVAILTAIAKNARSGASRR